jgi:hypothetical protein
MHDKPSGEAPASHGVVCGVAGSQSVREKISLRYLSGTRKLNPCGVLRNLVPPDSPSVRWRQAFFCNSQGALDRSCAVECRACCAGTHLARLSTMMIIVFVFSEAVCAAVCTAVRTARCAILAVRVSGPVATPAQLAAQLHFCILGERTPASTSTRARRAISLTE